MFLFHIIYMTRLEKIELAIWKGFTYDPITGKIYGASGREIMSKSSVGYVIISLRENKKVHKLLGHQFAWYLIHNEIVEEIDHINEEKQDAILNKSDNRISNLRSVTHQGNQHNRTKSKGYSWHKIANKFMSSIGLNGKIIHLGYFDKEEDAHQAYLDAKKLYHIIK